MEPVRAVEDDGTRRSRPPTTSLAASHSNRRMYGSAITITRDPAITGAGEDVHATIEDALKSLCRRLEQLREPS